MKAIAELLPEEAQVRRIPSARSWPAPTRSGKVPDDTEREAARRPGQD